MKKKFELDDFDFISDYHLMSIVSPLLDFKLAWHLNYLLKTELQKKNDITLKIDKSVEEHAFSFYYFYNEEYQKEYFLLSNKGDNIYLIPELKQYDFFLLLTGEWEEDEAWQVLDKTKEIDGVVLAKKIDLEHELGAKKAKEWKNRMDSILSQIESFIQLINKDEEDARLRKITPAPSFILPKKTK